MALSPARTRSLLLPGVLAVLLAAPSAVAQTPVPLPRPRPVPQRIRVPLALPSTDQLVLTFVTGDDDLRSSSLLRVRVLHVDGSVLTPLDEGPGIAQATRFSDRQTVKARDAPSWENGSRHTVRVRLNRTVALRDIGQIELDVLQGSCSGCTTDHWRLNRLEVRADGATGPVVLQRQGNPLWRTDQTATSSRFSYSARSFRVNADRAPSSRSLTTLDLEMRTRRDDLRNGVLHARVRSTDGELLAQATLNVDEWGGRLEEFEAHAVARRTLRLQRAVPLSAIASVELYVEQPDSNEAFFDNWDLDELTVRNHADGSALARHGAYRFTGRDHTLVVPIR